MISYYFTQTNQLFDESMYMKMTGKYRSPNDNVLIFNTLQIASEQDHQFGSVYRFRPHLFDHKNQILARENIAVKREERKEDKGDEEKKEVKNDTMVQTFVKCNEEQIYKDKEYKMEYCVECKTAGTLINCESCPISFHIECLGFKRVLKSLVP